MFAAKNIDRIKRAIGGSSYMQIGHDTLGIFSVREMTDASYFKNVGIQLDTRSHKNKAIWLSLK